MSTKPVDPEIKSSPKPKVFLSYPFSQRNEWIEHCVSPLLELWGCKVLTGRKYYGRDITREVGSDIAQSQLLVAFLTRYQRLTTGDWTTSGWVLQETGFAAGKGIPVVLVGELGVEVKGGIVGGIQVIELDADREAFWALPQLRHAVKHILFRDEPDEELAVCHMAKFGRKDHWNRQWWDFWLWIDGSDQALESIAEVKYEFGKAFDPECEAGDPEKAFGNISETDGSFIARAKIRFDSGKRKVVRHKVTVPGTGITPFSKTP